MNFTQTLSWTARISSRVRKIADVASELDDTRTHAVIVAAIIVADAITEASSEIASAIREQRR